MEENEKSGGSVLAKTLTIIGLATVVAAAVTVICKKVAAKKKAQLAKADESTIDDYEECCFDCEDDEDCGNCDIAEDADEEITE